MHTVRARALQSVVAAPANCRACSRHPASRRTTARAADLGAVRGFRNSATTFAQPDESGKDDKPPAGIAGSSESTEDAPSTPHDAAASASDASSTTNAADVPGATKEAAAPAAVSTSTYTGGRTRSIRSRTTDGTPSFTLPEWFGRYHVRSFDTHQKKDKLLSTSFSQDLEAASLLMYPRGSPKFSTEPQARPLNPIPYESTGDKSHFWLELEQSDRLQIQEYFTAILDGSGWTDHKVQLAVEQMRTGTGLDAVARRGASVAAAAAYVAAAVLSRGSSFSKNHEPQKTPSLLLPPGSGAPGSEETTASGDKTASDIPISEETTPAVDPVSQPLLPLASVSHSGASSSATDADVAEPSAESPESSEIRDANFNADLFKKLDPHGVLDIPSTPFGGGLVEFMRLTMGNTNELYLMTEADIATTLGIPISTKFYERAMFREVQASVAAKLAAPAPDTKAVRRDWRRPVTVLTMIEHHAPGMVEGLLDEIALSLSARIVHIDARTIASLAGPYLGQSPLLSRGSIAMLGYTAARLNGRLVPRYPKSLTQEVTHSRDDATLEEAMDDEDVNQYVYSRDGESGSDSGGSDGDTTLSRLPMDLMSTTRSALRSDAEDRWDDLKMNHVLEAIVRSADGDAPKGATMPASRPPLIIHLHNFIELSSTFDGNQILFKLRGIVDRLWQKERRKIMLVGSSAILHEAPDLIDRAEELRQDDCDIVPFQLQLDHYQYKRRMIKAGSEDVFEENMHNICEMVSALTGTKMMTKAIPWLEEFKTTGIIEPSLSPLMESLQRGVYDIHWVYRIATLWVGIIKGKHIASPPESDPGGSNPASIFSLSSTKRDTFFTTFSDFSTALSLSLLSPSPAASLPSSPASSAFPSEYSKLSFINACWTMNKLDQMWHFQGGGKGYYHSPLLIKRYRKGKKSTFPPSHLWWWKTTQQQEFPNGTSAHKDEESYVVPSRDSIEDLANSGAKTADSTGAGDNGTTSSPKKPNYDAYNFNKHEQRFLKDIVDPADLTTTFDSIVLPARTKDSIKALTSLSLIRPEAFRYGVLATEHIPGCLLYGPPGTGKTLLAKAVAKQSGAKMLEISAATINDMWVGEAEKNVRAAFSVARALAPIVVFIDEADALLAARHEQPGRNGQREMINQFLREWDGLSTSKGGGDTSKKTPKNQDSDKVFIMVATNRPGDLDEAVLRRLPRRILVDLPMRDARLSILRVLLQAEQLDTATVSLEKLADETDLYSGSDLKNLCVAAAMQAVREEVAAMEAHNRDLDLAKGGEPYVFPEKRTLTGKHFAYAMQEIGASISEDMASLKAIRKFDERYGDHGSKKRKKNKGMGFEVAPKQHGTKEAMVRRD